MRLIQAAVVVVLAAAALAASSQPASAAYADNVDYGVGTYATCSPDYQAGVHGQYGAWGSFIPGCKMRLTCPNTRANCLVGNRSTITTQYFQGQRVTMNARIWIYGTDGSVRGWRDRSCDGTNSCSVGDSTWIYPGESAAVECNGVRATVAGNQARVRCQVNVQREGYCLNRNTSVNQLSQVDAERTVLCLTNLERYNNGLSLLTPNDQLTNAARGHATDAVNRPWWTSGRDWHTNPYTGSTPLSRINAAGYCPGRKSMSIAENVYWGAPDPTPYQAVRWWMNSTGHRANILNANLSELGVGIVRGDPSGSGYANAGTFVQNFGNCINY